MKSVELDGVAARPLSVSLALAVVLIRRLAVAQLPPPRLELKIVEPHVGVEIVRRVAVAVGSER